ncbi:MAG: hypothetical protein ACHQFZ_08490 [Acidimicrobiales bacterium]
MSRNPLRRATPAGRRASVESGERGSTLILALVFLVAVSVVVLLLANWATGNLGNTAKFQNASEKLYAAEGATQVALRASRYTYPPNTSATGYVCPGLTTPLVGINGLYVQDWCVTTTAVSPVITRQVTLTACLLPSAASTLTAPCQVGVSTTVPTLLTAVVNFDDHTNAENRAVPNCTSTGNQSTCGANMTIVSWKAR